MAEVDVTLLLMRLRSYSAALDRHLHSVQQAYDKAHDSYEHLRRVWGGNAAQEFYEHWGRTTEAFERYLTGARRLKETLDARIETLTEVDRPMGEGVRADRPVGSASVATRIAEVGERWSKAERRRRRDPGFGKGPVRPQHIPGDAAPFDPLQAEQVLPWGVDGSDATRGRWVASDGRAHDLRSGVNGPARGHPRGPGSGRNLTLWTHVESHAGALMKPGDNATLYLNRIPCTEGRAGGCERMLPRYVPRGAKLTTYGPDGYVQVVYGTGPVAE